MEILASLAVSVAIVLIASYVAGVIVDFRDKMKERRVKRSMGGVTMWAARDEDDDKTLYLFHKKPVSNEGVWVDGGTVAACLTGDVFPEVTYANSPRKVTLTLEEGE